MASSTLESEIEDYAVAQIEALGGVALKLRPPTGRGYPDRTCFLPGGYAWLVEFKRPSGGRVSKQQDAWRARLALAGHPVDVVQTREQVDAYVSWYKAEIGAA